MSNNGLLIPWTITIKIQLSILIWYKVDIIIISSNVTCSCHDIAKILLICRWRTIAHLLTTDWLINWCLMPTLAVSSLLLNYYIINQMKKKKNTTLSKQFQNLIEKSKKQKKNRYSPKTHVHVYTWLPTFLVWYKYSDKKWQGWNWFMIFFGAFYSS